MIGSTTVILAGAAMLKVVLDCIVWCYDVAQDDDPPSPHVFVRFRPGGTSTHPLRG